MSLRGGHRIGGRSAGGACLRVLQEPYSYVADPPNVAEPTISPAAYPRLFSPFQAALSKVQNYRH
jgi:hypothetical protein